MIKENKRSAWESISVGELEKQDLLLMRNGFPCGNNNEKEIGIPQIRPMNVDSSGKIDLSTIKSIQIDKKIDNYLIKKEDIIFNNTNSHDLVGKTAIWTGPSDEYVLSNHMTFLRFTKNSNVEPYFIAKYLYLLWINRYFEQIRRQHVNQASISLERLRDIEIPLPPLPEQRAIARVLRVVQAAREARLQELALERERKAALMEHLFAPADWRIMPLEECAFVQTGVTKGRKLDDDETINVPYLRVANVQDGYLDLDEIQTIEIRRSELERFLLQPKDILLTEGGDFDKLGRGFIWRGQIDQCIHQNHIFAVRVDKSLLLPEYLSYLIQSEYGKNYFLSVAHRTTHLACINSTKLKAFPTLVPDLERQKEIADSLNTCDAKIAALEHEARLHDELFRAMLEELMTGRLRAGDGVGLEICQSDRGKLWRMAGPPGVY